jgi:hypothetical protein
VCGVAAKFLAQLICCRCYIYLVEATPEIQDVAARLTTKATEELAATMHREFTTSWGIDIAAEWTTASEVFTMT